MPYSLRPQLLQAQRVFRRYSHICADSPKKLSAGFRYSAIANNQDGRTVHGDSKLLHGYLQSALRRGDTISYNKLLSLIVILNIEA